MPKNIGSSGFVVENKFFPNIKSAANKDHNQPQVDMKKDSVQQQAFKYFDRNKESNEQRCKNGADTGNKYTPEVFVLAIQFLSSNFNFEKQHRTQDEKTKQVVG